MALLTIVAFVVALFVGLGLSAWASVASMTDALDRTRRSTSGRTAAYPGQLTDAAVAAYRG